jgi:hypothetical protein
MLVNTTKKWRGSVCPLKHILGIAEESMVSAMSDGPSEIRRDGQLQSAINAVLRLWVLDKDYSKELEKLRVMSRGYFMPSGQFLARDMETGLFTQKLKDPEERLLFLSKHHEVSLGKLRRELRLKNDNTEGLKC